MRRHTIIPETFLHRRQPIYTLMRMLTYMSVAVLLAGCATTRVDDYATASEGEGRSLEGLTVSDVETRIRSEYQRWRGTPHVLGGTTSRGLDCSAFVQRVFDDAFELPLPRTTEDQVHKGRKISSPDLRPGDLVFFRPSKTRHVGIYLSGGEFAHVSSSEGVTISKLDLPYWRDAYWTSRRVLPDHLAGPIHAQHAEEMREVVESSSSRRTGW